MLLRAATWPSKPHCLWPTPTCAGGKHYPNRQVYAVFGAAGSGHGDSVTALLEALEGGVRHTFS